MMLSDAEWTLSVITEVIMFHPVQMFFSTNQMDIPIFIGLYEVI